MIEDMRRLEKIMANFSLYPVKLEGELGGPIARLIFCNILADKYEELRTNKPNNHIHNGYPRTPVSKYLNYKDNSAIKFQLRDGAINSIIGYKDYYHKYKMIQAGFNEDENYLKLEKLKIIRDDANAQMIKLTKKIIK